MTDWLQAGNNAVITGDFAQVEALRDEAWRPFDAVHCLMNNAGAGLRTPSPWEDLNGWKKQLDINLWGIVRGCHAFIPAMLEGDSATRWDPDYAEAYQNFLDE